MPDKKYSNRWYLFVLAALTSFFLAGMSRFSMLVLFREIAADLDLSLVQIGTVWGMDALGAVFICIPGGLILDRFGIKKIAVVYCLLAGLVGALRGLSGSFAALAGASFLYGIIAAMTILLTPKLVSYYFRGRHLGLMNALFFISIMLGQMSGAMLSATVLSPLLNGWRNVLFAFSIPSVIMGLLWLTTRPAPLEETSPQLQARTLSFRQIFSRVIRIKYLWLLGIVYVAHAGSFVSINAYLPLYLKGIGWSGAGADGALTLFLAATSLGTLPVVFLSDRLRNRRMFLFWLFLVVSIAISALYITRDPTVMILIIIFNGILRGAPNPLLITLAGKTPGTKPEYMGTSIGLLNTIGLLGGFIMPPLGNSFAAVNPAMPFIFWAGATVLLASTLLFIKTKAES